MTTAAAILVTFALLAAPTAGGDGESLIISEAKRDVNGFLVHEVRSPYQSGVTHVRVLVPDNLEAGRQYPVVYLLPVEAGDHNRYGDGLLEVKKHNLHNKFQTIFVAPTFSHLPWYADHPSDPSVRQETYFVKAIVPFIDRTYPAQRKAIGRLLVGFSKSGWGALSLLLRHRELFGKAAAWDAPLVMSRPDRFGMGEIFGTQENFEKYQLTKLLESQAEHLQKEKRILLMGYGNFRDQHEKAHALMTGLKIAHDYRDGPARKHDWHSGWVAEAVAWLQDAGIIAAGAKLEKLAGGFKFTEGPAADADGNVFFTDQPNDRILKWSMDGKLTTFLEPCGRANGLCFDAKGNLLACADDKNELWSIGPDKKITVLAKDYQDKLLNGPNDVWVRPDQGLYFTDPFYKRSYWKRGAKEQDVEAVYYLAPDRKKLLRVIDDLKQPNGIIGTPDGKVLYVADIGAGRTYAYDTRLGGTLADKRLFCKLGSDGMTIDNEGNVYLTGRGVTVFDRTGKQIEQIAVPEVWTANVCFGGRDRQTLFVTAMGNLYGLRMRVQGAGSQ